MERIIITRLNKVGLMVTKQTFKAIEDLEGVPPPMDEAWWESVLAEEKALKNLPSRTPPQAGPGGKGASPRASGEPAAVDWAYAMRLYELDEVVCLQVTGFNRGGLLVSGEKLQGFVPISHLVETPRNLEEEEQEDFLASYVGRELQLKVIECDQERGRVVFSERAALAKSGSRNQLLHQLKSGECVVGTVTNITDFGVFVDLGGVEGLIHVSEISWGRVRHPGDIVEINEKITVHVINVDQERSRVALSLKRMVPNPWETAESRYYPGQVVDATITSVVSFGAFARLEEGLDGLIHASEMVSDEGEPNPKDLLYEGQTVQVRVLHVDAAKQRLGLSLNLSE
jgi:small subunit ribosomal protein S1